MLWYLCTDKPFAGLPSFRGATRVEERGGFCGLSISIPLLLLLNCYLKISYMALFWFEKLVVKRVSVSNRSIKIYLSCWIILDKLAATPGFFCVITSFSWYSIWWFRAYTVSRTILRKTAICSLLIFWDSMEFIKKYVINSDMDLPPSMTEKPSMPTHTKSLRANLI